MTRILLALDKRRFLGFSIWEFSFLSLPRRYGRLFLWNIVLGYPLRTLKGLLAYRRLNQNRPPETEITQLFEGQETEWLRQVTASEGEFLVALGYCQKPLSCPAGRFNHDCSTLARPDLPSVNRTDLPAACRGCDIRLIGTASLTAGATVYIMTSAEDIAQHLFLPTLASSRFKYGIFVQCAYSVPAMALPLLICGVQARIISYCEGDCRDYIQFLAADVGIKDEQTHLTSENLSLLHQQLRDLTAKQQAEGRFFHSFVPHGQLFVPAHQEPQTDLGKTMPKV